MARSPGQRPTKRAISRSTSARLAWLSTGSYPTTSPANCMVSLKGKRGDLGKFTLKPGVAIKGRVLDVDGKPIAGIFVNAERERDQQAGEILGGLAVADAINRSAVTDNEGWFTLAPLPAGHYRVLPGERARDGSERHKLRPLPAVFTPRKVSLQEGETPEPLEIRASPHVVIEAQWVDGKGKPTSGFAGHLFGQIDGDYWFGEIKVDASGKAIAQVPHGLENVQLNLMTNEHHAIRWRRAKTDPLSRGRTIMLGTLDHDVKGIEIVHFTAPIVIVKGQTKDRKPVPGLKVSATYSQQETGQMDGKRILAGGVRSDVGFEKQEDGRFRSSQLQPDLEFNVVAEADGFKPEPAASSRSTRGRPRRSHWLWSRNESHIQISMRCEPCIRSCKRSWGSFWSSLSGPCGRPEPKPLRLPDGPALEHVDFDRHVASLFGRLGCNAGACHGSFQGRGGLNLSLFGHDPRAITPHSPQRPRPTN